jgi:hypothetical protein
MSLTTGFSGLSDWTSPTPHLNQSPIDVRKAFITPGDTSARDCALVEIGVLGCKLKRCAQSR